MLRPFVFFQVKVICASAPAGVFLRIGRPG